MTAYPRKTSLSIFYTITICFSYTVSVAAEDKPPLVSCIEEVPEGRACEIRSASAECNNDEKTIIFWNEYLSESTLMNIDGSDRKLSKISEEPFDKFPSTSNFKGDGYLVKVLYNSAPSTCPKDKVENDDGCEYTDVSAEIEIIRESDKKISRLLGIGECGC